jgi:hypothetical protein
VNDLNKIESSDLRKYVFHVIGQLINEIVTESPDLLVLQMPWLYDSSQLTDDQTLRIMDERMNVVSDDFSLGWGKREFQRMCHTDESECRICSVDVWKVGKPRVHDTCYFTKLKCGCRNRYHLKCIIEYFHNLDKFDVYQEIPPLSAIENESDAGRCLGVDMRCMNCNTLQDDGYQPWLHVHSVSGCLVKTLLVPINLCATPQIAQNKHNLLDWRRKWTVEELKPLLKDETERLKIFNYTTGCYFAEEKDENVVDAVDNDESVVNTVDNDDSNIAELGAKEDMNKGKEMAKDPNTSKTSKTSIPNLVEEQNIEKTVPTVVPEKPVQQNNLTSSEDTPDQETPKSPSTTTITERNLEKIAPSKKTLKTVVEGDSLQKKVSTTKNSDYNTKLRQRKDLPDQRTKHRRKRKRRGGRILNAKDVEDDVHVWDKFDNVPFNYSFEKNDNRRKHYKSKEEIKSYVDDLFWTPTRKANMSKLQEDRKQINLEDGRGQNKNHMAKLQLARVLDRDIDEEEDHYNRELCAQTYDQITRLKVVYFKGRKKPIRIGYLSDNETDESEENWWGKFLDGRTVELYTGWIVDVFHPDVVAHIKKNPNRFICVPPGAPELSGLAVNEENKLGDHWEPPVSRPLIWAKQSKKDWKCLFYSLASVLYHLDDEYGANFIKHKGDTLPLAHIHHGTIHDLLTGILKYSNVQKKKNCGLEQVHKWKKTHFFVAQLCAEDGGVEHAIGILDDWIFDSNCHSVVPLTYVSLNNCCSGTFQKFKLLYIIPKKFNSNKRISCKTKQNKTATY